MCWQEDKEKLAAELAEVKAKGSGDAEALGRAKQQLAELSEDLEAANRELEVLQHILIVLLFLLLHLPKGNAVGHALPTSCNGAVSVRPFLLH